MSKKLVAPELAVVQVGGMTRQSFMLRSTLAAGAAVGATMATPYIHQAVAQESGGDIDILNFALTLEYLEAKFYEEALDKVSGLEGDLKSLAEEIQKNEAEHVDALKKAIEGAGGTPVDEPTFDFGNAFDSESAFLKLANTLEDTGVSAYNGAGPMIQNKEILGSAGAIVQVEARHAALIRLARNKPPAPLSSDKPATVEQVTEAVKPLIKS